MIHRVTIRKATKEDLPSVWELLSTERRSIQYMQEYSKEQVLEHILYSKVWVAIHTGLEKGVNERHEGLGLVGAMCVNVTTDRDRTPLLANVLFLVCRDELRIEGVASGLASHLINYNTMGVTWVAEWLIKESNVAMAAVWQRFKFKPEEGKELALAGRFRYVQKITIPVTVRYETLRVRFVPG